MITRGAPLTLLRSRPLPARAAEARELRSYPGSWTIAPNVAGAPRVITFTSAQLQLTERTRSMQVDRNGRPTLLDATGRIPRPDILDYAMGRATREEIARAAGQRLAEAREQAWAALNTWAEARRIVPAGHGAITVREAEAIAGALWSMAGALQAMLQATA